MYSSTSESRIGRAHKHVKMASMIISLDWFTQQNDGSARQNMIQNQKIQD